MVLFEVQRRALSSSELHHPRGRWGPLGNRVHVEGVPSFVTTTAWIRAPTNLGESDVGESPAASPCRTFEVGCCHAALPI